jgi:hypothetical protein
MPLWVGAILGGLIEVASSLVGRVLLALGIGFVAYTGIDTSINAIKAQIVSAGGALPMGLAGMLGVLKIGEGISILFSALIARLTLNGLTSGTIKRMVIK